MTNNLAKLCDRMAVKWHGLNPDEVIYSRGTQKLGNYSLSEYRGILVVVGDNGNSGVRRLGGISTDNIGDWTDLQLLPENGVKITKVGGEQETYTADKRFIEAVVKSWANKRGIEV